MSDPSRGEPQNVKWLISGRVQGVSYRWFTRSKAQPLGLVGTVRNLADGRVEALVQGNAEQLAELHRELLVGPRLGRVDGIEGEALSAAESALLEQASSFEIVH